MKCKHKESCDSIWPHCSICGEPTRDENRDRPCATCRRDEADRWFNYIMLTLAATMLGMVLVMLVMGITVITTQ